MLKLLDMMQDMLDKNFEDHLAVSQDLFKFLFINTSVEAVEYLMKRMSSAESKVQQTKMELKGIHRSPSTIGNKFDNLAGKIKDIVKQLTKVEKEK